MIPFSAWLSVMVWLSVIRSAKVLFSRQSSFATRFVPELCAIQCEPALCATPSALRAFAILSVSTEQYDFQELSGLLCFAAPFSAKFFP